MIAAIVDEDTGVEELNKGGKPAIMGAAEKLAEAGHDIKNLSTIFKLLSDETRLKILFILREADEMNVLELCRILGQRQPSVSHHLALLRVNGLIGMRRDGKHNFYRILLSRLDEFVGSILKVAPGRNRTATPAETASREAASRETASGETASLASAEEYSPDDAKA